jgi:hypothetical protein
MLSSLPIPSKYYIPISEKCNNSSLHLYAFISAYDELKRKLILEIPGKKRLITKNRLSSRVPDDRQEGQNTYEG